MGYFPMENVTPIIVIMEFKKMSGFPRDNLNELTQFPE